MQNALSLYLHAKDGVVYLDINSILSVNYTSDPTNKVADKAFCVILLRGSANLVFFDYILNAEHTN